MTTATPAPASRKPRQTAGNCPALARIKRTFNGKVYAIALRKMNEDGLDAVRAFVREFFNEESQGRADEIVDGTDTASVETTQ
jgi:hypothetical protein